MNVDNIYHYKTLNTLCDCLFSNSFVTDGCNCIYLVIYFMFIVCHDDWCNSVESIILQYEYDPINKYRIICGLYNYTNYWTKHPSIYNYYMNKYGVLTNDSLMYIFIIILFIILYK